jgi:hypothetical protein
LLGLATRTDALGTTCGALRRSVRKTQGLLPEPQAVIIRAK